MFRGIEFTLLYAWCREKFKMLTWNKQGMLGDNSKTRCSFVVFIYYSEKNLLVLHEFLVIIIMHISKMKRGILSLFSSRTLILHSNGWS